MYNKRILKYMSVFMSVMLLLSGCKGDKTEEKKQSENGQKIVMQMRIPNSLNPLEAENVSVSDAFSLCYEPLFVLSDMMEPEGVLARSIQIADDARSAVITLKDGVLWHDGIKFTSGDVVHTINYLKENSHLQYAQCVKYIESVQSIDPLSLKITLSRPYGQIAYSLTFPIIASHNLTPEETVVGTGAYKLKKYLVSTSLELERFDKWHGGQAQCREVAVSVIRDMQTATDAFNTGVINTTTGESFDLQNSTPKTTVRSTLYPSSKYEFMAFNHKSSAFSSQAVRAAVSCALDRSEIASECFFGAADIANAPLHPGAKEIVAVSESVQYNLANAHELLFFEGYAFDEKTRLLKNNKGETLSFTLLVNSDNQNRIKTAQIIKKQLFNAGIEVEIKELSFEDYKKEIESGRFEAYLGGTRIGNLYDFEFLLSENGTLNSYGYTSEYMNLALSAIASSPSKDSLSDALFNFEEVFLREQPVCGLVFCKDTLITGEKVMGKLNPQAGFPYKNISKWSVK